MPQEIFEIPSSVEELFHQGENSYRIISHEAGEMDNIQSMVYFLDCIGATGDNVEVDDGTQVVLKHPNFNYKMVIDSGGLGDFYSHGFDVTVKEEILYLQDNWLVDENRQRVYPEAPQFSTPAEAEEWLMRNDRTQSGKFNVIGHIENIDFMERERSKRGISESVVRKIVLETLLKQLV